MPGYPRRRMLSKKTKQLAFSILTSQQAPLSISRSQVKQRPLNRRRSIPTILLPVDLPSSHARAQALLLSFLKVRRERAIYASFCRLPFNKSILLLPKILDLLFFLK